MNFLQNIFLFEIIKKYILVVPVGFTLLIIFFSVALVQADSPNRAGLMIVHEDGEVVKRCIEFTEEKISGYDVLERSGLDLNVDLSSSMGATICRIDNEGCTYPAEDCFCEYSNGIFWSYWYLEENEWKFSGVGASGSQVGDGDVEGWLWGNGATDSATQPPDITFADICPSLSTDTPTPTNIPTQTPVPTDTPEPTDTPTPIPLPTIHHFQVDRPTIDAGESVELRWDLSAAEVAYLQFDGHEEGVVSPGSKRVTPSQTTVYTLVTRNGSGETTAELTVTVNTPTATLLPAATVPSATPTPSPVPVEAVVPAPVIQFRTTASTVALGGCVLLSWEVENANTVYLDDEEIGEQGTQQVCPQEAQTYILRAVNFSGERTTSIQLEVVEPVSVADNPAVRKPTTMPAPTIPPALETTAVSQRAQPALEMHSPKPSRPAGDSATSREAWSLGARFGIWGTLVGGWCIFGLVATVVFAGLWWLGYRSGKA